MYQAVGPKEEGHGRVTEELVQPGVERRQQSVKRHGQRCTASSQLKEGQEPQSGERPFEMKNCDDNHENEDY